MHLQCRAVLPVVAAVVPWQVLPSGVAVERGLSVSELEFRGSVPPFEMPPIAPARQGAPAASCVMLAGCVAVRLSNVCPAGESFRLITSGYRVW